MCHLRYRVIAGYCGRAAAVLVMKIDGQDCITYRFVVLQTVLVLVRLLTSNDRTSEWFGFIVGHQAGGGIWQASKHLLFADPPGEVAIWPILTRAQSHMALGLRL